MSKLTGLQIFLWKFTKIYMQSNHFTKKKKKKNAWIKGSKYGSKYFN